MTTRLTRNVAREVIAATSTLPLIVTLTPVGIQLRAKKSRTSFLLPYAVAYQRAAMLKADADVRERKSRRTVKRGLLSVGGGR